MVDDERERTRDTDHTTVVTTNGGGGGAGTVLAVVLAIVAIVIVLFLVFGGEVRDTTDVEIPEEVGVNINIDQPAVEPPPVAVPEPPPVAVPEPPPQDQDGNAS